MTSWNTSKIAESDREHVEKVLAEHYEDLRARLVEEGDDLSYPVVFEDEVLRWEPDEMCNSLVDCGALSLNRAIPPNVLWLSKRLGYSLAGYADLTF